MRANSTDELYIAAPRNVIARRLLDLSTDSTWWPGAHTSGEYGRVVVRAPAGARAPKRARRARRGLRRSVRFEAGIGPVREWDGFTWFLERGALSGRAEWWFEEFKEGTIVHHYLDAERGDASRTRRMASVVRRYRWAIRGCLNALKDELEAREHAR